ncbi:MAG: HAD-IIIA family hydrolase [Proteobacteria bacterium]|nr:HAD-IIIA family hydrolase [Pseudomonadota bacterium]
MKLVLLDRDGVINVSPGKSYVMSPSEMKLIKGAGNAIACLNKAQIKVAIITNQSIVGQGSLTLQDLDQIHEHLFLLLKKENASIDKIFFCPDAPYAPTHRRKPNPGMIHEALDFFKAEAQDTPFIGDSLTDLEAAFKAGCPRHLVRTGHGKEVEKKGIPIEYLPVIVHADLEAAVKYLLKK